MARTTSKPRDFNNRDFLTQVLNGSISKPKATASSTTTSGQARDSDFMQQIDTVYAGTTARGDKNGEGTDIATNMYPTLGIANDAANHIGQEEVHASEVKGLDKDGGFIGHADSSTDTTLDIRNDHRSPEVPTQFMSNVKPIMGQTNGMPRTDAKCAKKEQQYVFIATYQEYDRSGDTDNEQIIGVYGSVEKANAAAKKYMNDNVGEPTGDESEGSCGEESGAGDKVWQEEDFGGLGCITVNAEDAMRQQYCCSVARHAVE